MELRDETIKQIGRLEKVVNALDNSEAWKIVVEDYQRGEKMIDDSWINEFDEKRLKQFRVTKLASREVSQLLDKYKYDLELARKQLFQIDNPDKEIPKDWDNE